MRQNHSTNESAMLWAGGQTHSETNIFWASKLNTKPSDFQGFSIKTQVTNSYCFVPTLQISAIFVGFKQSRNTHRILARFEVRDAESW